MSDWPPRVAETHPYDILIELDDRLGMWTWDDGRLPELAAQHGRDASRLASAGEAVHAGGYARVAARIGRAALSKGATP